MRLSTYGALKDIWTFLTTLAKSRHIMFVARYMNIQSIINDGILPSALTAIRSTHIPNIIIEITHITEVKIYVIRISVTNRAKTNICCIYFQDRSAIISSPPSSSERSGEGEGGDEMR